jgi:hypothetical protein
MLAAAPPEHNTCLQGGGAQVMKCALIFVRRSHLVGPFAAGEPRSHRKAKAKKELGHNKQEVWGAPECFLDVQQGTIPVDNRILR